MEWVPVSFFNVPLSIANYPSKGTEKSNREERLRLPLDNSIARNRGQIRSGYGESILDFMHKNRKSCCWNPILSAFRCRNKPFSVKMDAAKQSLSQKQTFWKLCSFYAAGGESAVLSRPTPPQSGHWEGFLPMSFWMSCSTESFSFTARFVPVCSLHILNFFCFPRLERKPYPCNERSSLWI